MKSNLLLLEDNSKEIFNQGDIKLIGGLDISVIAGHEHNAVGCLVILTFPELEVKCSFIFGFN